ncbi:MAG: hypothetical protein WAM82_23245 [Thermoanaerobaculia bacterium]
MNMRAWIVLAGLLVPLAAVRAQTREPLRCGDAEVHHPSEAAVVRPELIQQQEAQVAGKTLIPSHPLLYEIVVSPEGRVCAARLLVGEETQEARSWLEALRQWQFRPATLNGKPVAFSMVERIGNAKEDAAVQAPPPPDTKTATGAAITRQQITIGGHAVPFPASRQQFAAVLGNPTRVQEYETNRILVWDPLGVAVYESRATGKIFEVAFFFQQVPKRDFVPHTLTGALTLGDAKVGPDSTLKSVGEEILRQGGQHVRRLAFGVWTLRYGGFDVTLEQIDSATLQTISVDLKP